MKDTKSSRENSHTHSGSCGCAFWLGEHASASNHTHTHAPQRKSRRNNCSAFAVRQRFFECAKLLFNQFDTIGHLPQVDNQLRFRIDKVIVIGILVGGQTFL